MLMSMNLQAGIAGSNSSHVTVSEQSVSFSNSSSMENHISPKKRGEGKV